MKIRLQLVLFFVWGTFNSSVCVAAEGSETSVQRGADLFYGRTEVNGKLYLHNRTLGSPYVRCVNCHQLEDQPKSLKVNANDNSFGPLLGAHFIQTPNNARGGPVRSYEPASFCKMLRSGMDPSQIMIRTDMPRYILTDDDCNALWSFLMAH